MSIDYMGSLFVGVESAVGLVVVLVIESLFILYSIPCIFRCDCCYKFGTTDGGDMCPPGYIEIRIRSFTFVGESRSSRCVPSSIFYSFHISDIDTQIIVNLEYETIARKQFRIPNIIIKITMHAAPSGVTYAFWRRDDGGEA